MTFYHHKEMELLPDELVRVIGDFVPGQLSVPISKRYAEVWKAQAKRVAWNIVRERLMDRMPLIKRAFRLEADCCPVCGRWMTVFLDLTVEPHSATLLSPFCAVHNRIFRDKHYSP